ncbi:hypothetical protein KDW_48860 [Dictyobacter vulcani]|uniref:Uncharacterized protein n=1 Tax=Dictyobacter vulcani TaxID=2607529 RepID=A0A5J4KN19_9CHLR|nr:hypothetical protein [Dictyobacter vulcani]GER90724.1 hypothetical protein KDW_48860 [Dictyobacter vulcani]
MQKTLSSFPPRKQGYPENVETVDVVTVGYSRRKIFWPVLFIAFLLLAGLVWQAMTGNLAIAANFPLPFTIQADRFDITNSTLLLGFSNSGHNVPVAIVTDNATAFNLRISKRIDLPFIGPVTFLLRTGNGNRPARLFGTRTDIQSLSASLDRIQNQSISSNARFGVRIFAGDQTFYNLYIKAPFISLDSALFPDMHLSVTR